MKSNRYIFLIIIGILIALLLGCNLDGDSNDAIVRIRVGGGSAAQASVTGPLMSTGLGGDTPFPIEEYNVMASAPDMPKIDLSFPGNTDTIEITLPAGNGRLIELFANVDPKSHGTIMLCGGKVETDLVAGDTVELTIKMDILETKLVIPDAGTKYNMYPGQIILIPNMQDADKEWHDIYGTELGITDTYFHPYDVDYDNKGKVYVVNNYNIAGVPVLLKFDDLFGGSYDPIIPDIGVGINSIAVDRVNNRIFFASTDIIYKTNLDGGSWNPIITELTNIYGLDVFNGEILFVAGNITGIGPGVFKYSLADNNKKAEYITDIQNPGDVLAIDDFVYLLNWDNTFSNNKIIRLDLNLSSPNIFGQGTNDTNNISPGFFLGPHRFIGILNKKLYMIDELEMYPTGDRIVSFNDPETWEEWEVLKPGDFGKMVYFYEC